jgi:predicted branched-subunit amino acid permease
MAGFWLGFRRCPSPRQASPVWHGLWCCCSGQGLTFLDAFFLQSLLLAGASQYVALELWTDPLTWTTAFAMAAVVFTVNLRMMLLGAACAHGWAACQPTSPIRRWR